jgi:hypothetical protein
VTFIRRVSAAGTVTALGPSFRVGKKHRGLDLRRVVDSGRGRRTASRNGHVLKRWPSKLLNNGPTPKHAVAGGTHGHS